MGQNLYLDQQPCNSQTKNIGIAWCFLHLNLVWPILSRFNTQPEVPLQSWAKQHYTGGLLNHLCGSASKWKTCPSLKFMFIEAGVLRCTPLQINKRTVPPASPGRHRPSSTRSFLSPVHPFLLLLQLLPVVLLVVFPTVHPVIQLQENHKVTTAAAAAYRLTRTNKILHVHKLELECITYHG